MTPDLPSSRSKGSEDPVLVSALTLSQAEERDADRVNGLHRDTVAFIIDAGDMLCQTDQNHPHCEKTLPVNKFLFSRTYTEKEPLQPS